MDTSRFMNSCTRDALYFRTYEMRLAQLRETGEFECGEMPRDTYLRVLSPNERHAMVIFFDSLEDFRRGGMCTGFSALAVGTTTYPEEYWAALGKALARDDPSKLHYVKRRGQDLDIKLCSDCYGEPPFKDEGVKFMARDLTRAGIPFKIEEEKSESGTGYLKRPPQIGGVMRYKRAEYGSDKFVLRFPSCRPIHVSFERSLCAELKLLEERIGGYSFSVLFRHSDFGGLAEAIDLVDASPSLFNEQLNTYQRANSPALNRKFQDILSSLRAVRAWEFEQLRLTEAQKREASYARRFPPGEPVF